MADFADNGGLLSAVDGLERAFRQIQHDLSCASHRLDVSFDESSARDGSQHPLKLMRRIKNIEATASSLQAEWSEIQEARARIIPEVSIAARTRLVPGQVSPGVCSFFLSSRLRLVPPPGCQRPRGQHGGDHPPQRHCWLP